MRLVPTTTTTTIVCHALSPSLGMEGGSECLSAFGLQPSQALSLRPHSVTFLGEGP